MYPPGISWDGHVGGISGSRPLSNSSRPSCHPETFLSRLFCPLCHLDGSMRFSRVRSIWCLLSPVDSRCWLHYPPEDAVCPPVRTLSPFAKISPSSQLSVPLPNLALYIQPLLKHRCNSRAINDDYFPPRLHPLCRQRSVLFPFLFSFLNLVDCDFLLPHRALPLAER